MLYTLSGSPRTLLDIIFQFTSIFLYVINVSLDYFKEA